MFASIYHKNQPKKRYIYLTWILWGISKHLWAEKNYYELPNSNRTCLTCDQSSLSTLKNQNTISCWSQWSTSTLHTHQDFQVPNMEVPSTPYLRLFWGVGCPVSISRIHTAYMGEDSSIWMVPEMFGDCFVRFGILVELIGLHPWS